MSAQESVVTPDLSTTNVPFADCPQGSARDEELLWVHSSVAFMNRANFPMDGFMPQQSATQN